LNRGINEFKKSYQLRTNIVKNEKGDMITHSYSIISRWKNYFSQLLNVYGVPELSASEVEVAIENLRSHKSLATDQIPAELFKAGGRRLALRFINVSFLFGINRNCLRSGMSRS
jgi:hypothetical protein